MSLFGKLFGGSAHDPQAKKAAKRIVENVRKQTEPFQQLLSNLIHAVCQSAEEVKRYFTPEKLKDPIAGFALRQQFLYYFIHITKRLAFSSGYNPQEMDDLGSVLFLLLEGSVEEVPEFVRKRTLEIALHNGNVAEMDYATAKGVYPENDPAALGESVYAKLARRIEEKLGQQHNPEIAFQIIVATSEQLIKAGVSPLLEQIRPFLNQYVKDLGSIRRNV
jgi:hypothetical protein